MKLKPLIKEVYSEALDSGKRTLGGSYLDRDQTVFNIDTVKDACQKLNSEIDAKYVNARFSTLGGERNVSILMSLSLDFEAGIFENSLYSKFHIQQDGVIEQISKSHKIPQKFRKSKAKNLDGVISKINSYLDTIK